MRLAFHDKSRIIWQNKSKEKGKGMRIGIVTFPGSTSFGASLQMYALYSAVKSLHVDVDILNYQNMYMKKGLHTKAAQNSALKNLCRRALHMRQEWAFRAFEKDMTMVPRRILHDPNRLPEISKCFDAMICGSDQVWNPDVTGEDLSYFLNFCSPETRRISYAPSFGLTSLPEDFAQKVRRELEQFQFISVREEEGQNLVEQMLHQDAPVVVDPTLLLNRDDWAGLERKHPAAEGEYILYYTVRSSKTLERFCKELAEKKNMKIIRVGGNMLSGLKNRNPRLAYASDIGPREWLYLVHHADCVVTNSFHGTAFSLIFQKDFYVEFSSTANSRMENLVRMTGLPSRIVKDGKSCADADESIDYADVNTRLQVAREQSWDYLRRAVGDK